MQEMNRHDEAIAHYDNLMQHLGSSDYEWVNAYQGRGGGQGNGGMSSGPPLALVFVEKGKVLEKQGKWEQAVAAYGEAIAAYDAMELQRISELFLMQAAILKQQKGQQAANAVYDKIVSHIKKIENRGDADRHSGLDGVAGMANQICIHYASNTYGKGLDAFDACTYVFHRIGQDNPQVQKLLQNAADNKAQRDKILQEWARQRQQEQAERLQQ
ncbi:MAG: hypothetical protein LBO00_06950 [Zoogloeaceae bacterium]|nr:hypothetical protein [Zoogloeaceae bacterium]